MFGVTNLFDNIIGNGIWGLYSNISPLTQVDTRASVAQIITPTPRFGSIEEVITSLQERKEVFIHVGHTLHHMLSTGDARTWEAIKPFGSIAYADGIRTGWKITPHG